MPRLTADTLLQRAIEPAVEDRLALVDAYGGIGPDAQAASQQAKAFAGLRGRRIDTLSAEERVMAFAAFVYAEQYETSLADASVQKGVIRDAMRAAKQFRDTRVALWGRTKQEVFLESAILVDSMEHMHSRLASCTQLTR
jgi:hypothetical protein